MGWEGVELDRWSRRLPKEEDLLSTPSTGQMAITLTSNTPMIFKVFETQLDRETILIPPTSFRTIKAKIKKLQIVLQRFEIYLLLNLYRSNKQLSETGIPASNPL